MAKKYKNIQIAEDFITKYMEGLVGPGYFSSVPELVRAAVVVAFGPEDFGDGVVPGKERVAMFLSQIRANPDAYPVDDIF